MKVIDQMVIWEYLEALPVWCLVLHMWWKKGRRLANLLFSLPGRKMKPLLPRINSYLVPIQFPMSQPLVLQPPLKVPLSVAQGTSHNSSETFQSNKRVRIAPKVVVFFVFVFSLPCRELVEWVFVFCMVCFPYSYFLPWTVFFTWFLYASLLGPPSL